MSDLGIKKDQYKNITNNPVIASHKKVHSSLLVHSIACLNEFMESVT